MTLKRTLMVLKLEGRFSWRGRAGQLAGCSLNPDVFITVCTYVTVCLIKSTAVKQMLMRHVIYLSALHKN